LLRVWIGDPDAESGSGFREEEFTLDRPIVRLAAEDINGDGRTDLLLAAAPSGIVTMIQNDDGRLQRGQDLEFEATSMVQGDLNADGRSDLLIAGDRTLTVFYAGT